MLLLDIEAEHATHESPSGIQVPCEDCPDFERIHLTGLMTDLPHQDIRPTVTGKRKREEAHAIDATTVTATDTVAQTAGGWESEEDRVLQELLQALVSCIESPSGVPPPTPTIVFVARSAEDGYTPPNVRWFACMFIALNTCTLTNARFLCQSVQNIQEQVIKVLTNRLDAQVHT
jgi:hypothetical protein